MRIITRSKLLFISLLFMLLSVPANAAISAGEAAGMLPDQVGEIHARGAVIQPPFPFFEHVAPEDFGIVSAAARVYGNGAFSVTLIKTRSDSDAYALLTNEAHQASLPRPVKPGYVGTAGIDSAGGVTFFKGATLVIITNATGQSGNQEAVVSFARLFADTLDKGESEIPVLLKHLPGASDAPEWATYAVSLNGLQKVVGNQPVLDAVSFEGGAEAATSTYGQSRLVILEYTTPQIATESDARITERLKQLQAAGQPVPSAYRRVGNYSVFVFDAPDEKTAAQLIDQINYEQVVQWLGDNPRLLELAQRQYTETTANVIMSVLKASGLAIVLCFGIGALFGAVVFRRRRAQQTVTDAYSDAGGMLRLNLDEMTTQTDPARLLGRGDS